MVTEYTSEKSKFDTLFTEDQCYLKFTWKFCRHPVMNFTLAKN